MLAQPHAAKSPYEPHGPATPERSRMALTFHGSRMASASGAAQSPLKTLRDNVSQPPNPMPMPASPASASGQRALGNVLITASCPSGSVDSDWNGRVIEHGHARRKRAAGSLVNCKVISSCIRLDYLTSPGVLFAAIAIERSPVGIGLADVMQSSRFGLARIFAWLTRSPTRGPTCEQSARHILITTSRGFTSSETAAGMALPTSN